MEGFSLDIKRDSSSLFSNWIGCLGQGHLAPPAAPIGISPLFEQEVHDGPIKERRPMEAHIAATYQMRRLGKMPIDFLDIA